LGPACVALHGMGVTQLGLQFLSWLEDFIGELETHESYEVEKPMMSGNFGGVNYDK